MIPIPPQFALQFPLSDKYRTLNALYKEYQGLPLPLSTAAVSEGLEFVERVVASPVFNEDDKAAARELKDKLVENADGELL
jgi:hypothetical protein